MGMRTVNDPYGDPSVLVDTVFGTSYDAVRDVANNIDYVKKVANLFDSSETIVANIHQRYVSTEGQNEFELPVTVVSEVFVTVFVNGKWQSPSVTYTAYDTTLLFNQVLSEGDVVDAMIVSGETLHVFEQLKEEAEQYENRAREWAEAPENTEVEAGQYSAKHHSAMASAQRVITENVRTQTIAAQLAAEAAEDGALGAAATAADSATDAAASANSAAASADDAANAATNAAASAATSATTAASAAAAAAANATRFFVADLDDLPTDNDSFSVGDIIETRADGYSYMVVPSSEESNHITSGGVKVSALGSLVLIAAGQSNIASTNTHASEGGDLASDPRIKIWNGTNWVTWDPAAGIPAGVGVAGHNVVLFQAAKEALRQGVPAVWCVNDGHPGDAIAEWVGSGTTSPNWVSLKGKLDGAFASPEFATLGIETVDGLIWGQGESDGSSGFDLTYYQTSFETLKSQLRALPYFPRTTPITVLEMPPQPSASVTNAYIMDALPYDSDPHTSVTRTKGLQIGADTLHWTGTAMGMIGARAFARIAEGVGDSLNSPARITTPFMKVRFDPVFGKGLGINYAVADERIIMGSTSDVAGNAISQPFIAFDIDNALLMLSQHVRCYSGLTLLSYTGSNFADASHAVNTNPNKMAGTAYWDSVNRRLMVAVGTGPTAQWARFDSDSLVTPA